MAVAPASCIPDAEHWRSHRRALLQASINGRSYTFQPENASWLSSLSPDEPCDREQALSEIQARKQYLREMRAAQVNVDGLSQTTIAAVQVLKPSRTSLHEAFANNGSCLGLLKRPWTGLPAACL